MIYYLYRNQEGLLEAKDNYASVYSGFEKQLIRFYHHCLKWIYQPTRQGNSWIESIAEGSYNAEKIYNDDNRIRSDKNIDLHKIYLLAVKETVNTIGKFEDDEYVYTTFSSYYSSKYNEYDIGIFDRPKIKEWLIQNANPNDTSIINKINNNRFLNGENLENKPNNKRIESLFLKESLEQPNYNEL